jgi:aminotransferase
MDYNDKLSKVTVSLPPSGIRKFFDLVVGREDIVSLGVGEPDFSTPMKFCAPAIEAIKKGKTSYTSNYGLLELREAIGDYLKRRFNVSYKPAGEMVITVGVSEALDISLRAIIDSGDEVIVPEPCFVSYVPMIRLAGGNPRILETSFEDGFRPRLELMENLISPRTKAILINYPCNPTGVTFSEDDLTRIAGFARRHNLLVISDEVYGELTFDRPHISIASLPDMWERTILLSGFSKAFAMTGWRLGYVCAPKPLIDQIVKIHQYSMMCASIMAQIAAIEACRNGDDEVKKMLDEYRARREVIVEGFNRLGMDCLRPEGAFYAFPSIKKFGLSSEEFCERLLNEEKVALVPGNSFGRAGEGHIRCSFAASRERIRLALEGLGRFLQRRTDS